MHIAARLPLPVLHALGAALGWVIYLSSPRYRAQLNDNIAIAGYTGARLRARAIAEAGKLITETPALWLRPHAAVGALVREVSGRVHLEQARAAGRSIVMVSPHLGSFEMVSQYVSLHHPFTVLYRASKFAWLDQIMRAGRSRPQVRLARADLSGVRELLAALKRREAIGLVADQVPGQGEGEWVDFFGKPAYTMTLAAKLAAREHAVCLLAIANRLPMGRGYRIDFRPLPPSLPGETPARTLNRAFEALIREYPEQYLWGYNRYKVPAGAVKAAPVRVAP